LVEIWEMRGPEGTVYAATCLSCGWYGGHRRRRGAATAEGDEHERGGPGDWQIGVTDVRSRAGRAREQRTGFLTTHRYDSVTIGTDASDLKIGWCDVTSTAVAPD
jgi:hypothetical protein